ncbi:unnamed protein product [Medioppia subpectinata]|uniref:Nuclear receptor domain-containing protein n=1 Tax=Medioppia subpectinata TaxID=1979941 RepID=A0A7R9KD02_9ACAR|nr:unnamed protein product [Medioppia subpectinata]CAG2100002.1 unnamed protein product [Medioppia subpectinata]
MDMDEVIILCAICGDTAVGKHFGVMACKSCKPFFRRNALKDNVFKCKLNGKCVINRETRKLCRKCRLDKCLAVGMKTECIMNDEEKQYRNQLIQQNRQKRQQLHQNHNKTNFNNILEEIDLQNITNIEMNDKSMDDIIFSPTLDDNKCMNELSDIICNEETDEDVSNNYTNDLIVSNLSSVFTERENKRYLELFRASRYAYHNVMNKSTAIIHNSIDMNSITDQFYNREIGEVIKLSNSLGPFQEMCANDRLALVKYGCLDIIILRCIEYYDLPQQQWTVVLDENNSLLISLEMFANNNMDLYNAYKTHFHRACAECDSDAVVLDLPTFVLHLQLTAIILFSPDRQNLMHRNVVKRKRVMNDDILGFILKDLNINDLFALQRVSQQFNDCSQEALRRRSKVSVGFNDVKASSMIRCFNWSFEVNDWHLIDITQAINTSLKGIDMALGKEYRLESIVRQFRGVKELYLFTTVISFKTLELIVNQWPHLKKIRIYNIEVLDSNQTITEWAQLLSKVKYISIGSIDTKYVSILTNIIQRMPSLVDLRVWGYKPNISDQKITLSLLTDSMPEDLRLLYIGVTSADSQAIDVITSKCTQIKKLFIYESCLQSHPVDIDLWNQWFALICDRLKCLIRFNTRLGGISAKNFAQSIAKLKELKVLEITDKSYEWIQCMCFDTQEMAKYMQPMVSLKELSLDGLKCSPNRWSNLSQMLPNVRKFSISNISYDTDCKDNAPKNSHSPHILELFTRVDRLSIHFVDEELIQVLITFLTETLANRRRVFRLDLLPIVKRQLIQKMEEMNVSMPESVITSHVFNRREEYESGEEIKRKDMNEMNGQRSDVMNDDILGLIFKYFDIKDLFGLQRVSQQFRDCSQEVLKRKREMSVGFNDLKTGSVIRNFKQNFEVKDWNRLDITPAITSKDIDLTLDYSRKHTIDRRLETIVRQFCGATELYLSSTVITFKTMQLFVNQWPQLESINIYDIKIYGSSDQTITEWIELLSKVKQLKIGSIDTKYVPSLKYMIKNLPSLQTLNVGPEAFSQNITLSILTDCLPENIRYLHIGVSSMDSQAIDVITSKCQQIRKLSICDNPEQIVDSDLWSQWFAMICDRLKQLTHLKVILGDISAKDFAQSIAKLKDLKKLEISDSEGMPGMCFDTQELAKYMPPMVSLRSLSLYGLKCSPNRWSNVAQMLPNVRHLSLSFMDWSMDCNEGDDCKECFHRCMDLVSKVPKLKYISLTALIFFSPDRQNLMHRNVVKRKRVMNDDILGFILKDLDLKDLFSLQRVSQQFSRCSQQEFLRKSKVSVGFNALKTSSELRYFNRNFEVNDWHRIDITHAITTSLKGIDMALGKEHRLESIVRQFLGVKDLYLSTTVISFKTLEVMVNQWPHLKKLLIYDIEVFDSNDQKIPEWAQLLSKVKHISIGSIDTKYVSFWTNIIQRMSSLVGLSVWGDKPNISDQNITLSLLTDCLPTNLQFLRIGVSSTDSQAIDVITSKCPQIKKLAIYESSVKSSPVEMDLWNQWFALICDRLKCLTYLFTRLGGISAKDFAQSIAKLKDLKVLYINESSNEWIQSMCFDTQSMAKYMPPMVSLKTLSLSGFKCSPNRWSNLAQMFPNVRTFSVDNMCYENDCNDGYYCSISWHILELFAGVDRLSIDREVNEDLMEVLIHFLTETLANRRQVFRLDLLPKVKRQLIQRMATMNIPIPKILIRSDVMNDDILGLIFKYLDIKDLFGLQRVSQQFRDCSQQVLQRRRKVSFGFNDLKASSLSRCLNYNFEVNDWHRIDITQAVNTSLKGIDMALGIEYRLESIVRQFRGVKDLYLSTTVISFKTLKLIVNQCPHLKKLRIHTIDVHTTQSNDHTITEWAQLLSKIKHIFIGNYLPTNMRYLYIGATSVDSQAIDVITGKCQQIRKLTIFGSVHINPVENNLWKQWFVMICDRLKTDPKNVFRHSRDGQIYAANGIVEDTIAFGTKVFTKSVVKFGSNVAKCS